MVVQYITTYSLFEMNPFDIQAADGCSKSGEKNKNKI